MKLRTKIGLMVAFFVLAIAMGAGAVPVGTFTSELSPTAPGQTFYGDGAVYGDGYLQAPPANNQGDKCLECHQGIPADFDPTFIIPDKRVYLRTGHGNMLERVTAPPQVWRGPNGLPYPTTSVGHPIDWATGKVDLLGFCDVGGFEGQFEKEACEAKTACTLDASNYPAAYADQATCEASSGTWKPGTWTPATRLADMTYFIGPWMSVDAPDTGISGAGLPVNKFMMADGRTYGTCGSCHNGGYKANDYTRPQPFTDYPSNPAVGPGGLPRSSAAGVGGSWVLNGIQCERCHDATQHYAPPYIATVAKGASSTALCSQCHIRPANYEGSANPNASTQPTAYPIGASATNFGSHLIGKQFLNSPHGLFTGPYGKIATTDAGFYNSHFSEGTCSKPEYLSRSTCQAAGGTWTSIQGGCATCHDVHQTTFGKFFPEGPDEGLLPFSSQVFATTAAAQMSRPEPIRRECGIACHSSRANFTNIRHSAGTGTPLEGRAPEACAICHMPKPPQPGGSEGLATHVFRISTDPDYSTFPKQVGNALIPGYCSDPTYTTRATCVAAGKAWSGIANSAPDGTYKNAVWIDLDLACGKCHGGGTTASGAKVYPLTKKQLAVFAKDMHMNAQPNTRPVAAMLAWPTVIGRTVTVTDNSWDNEDGRSKLRVTVNWGDDVSEGVGGGTFTHTYEFDGTYTITHTVTDTKGLVGYENFPVTVPKQGGGLGFF